MHIKLGGKKKSNDQKVIILVKTGPNRGLAFFTPKRSGVYLTAVFGASYNRNFFKDPFGHRYHYHYRRA